MNIVLNNHMLAILQKGAKNLLVGILDPGPEHTVFKHSDRQPQETWTETPGTTALDILLLLKQKHTKVFKAIRI